MRLLAQCPLVDGNAISVIFHYLSHWRPHFDEDFGLSSDGYLFPDDAPQTHRTGQIGRSRTVIYLYSKAELSAVPEQSALGPQSCPLSLSSRLYFRLDPLLLGLCSRPLVKSSSKNHSCLYVDSYFDYVGRSHHQLSLVAISNTGHVLQQQAGQLLQLLVSCFETTIASVL